MPIVSADSLYGWLPRMRWGRRGFLFVSEGYPMSLNQAQSLSLATTLRLLEDRCAQMHHLIAGDQSRIDLA